MTSTTRRTFVGAAAAISASIVLPGLAFGQGESSPAASATTAGALLKDLGLPEIVITATDDGLQIPADVTAGTVLLTLDNQSQGYASIGFVQLAEGISQADLEAGLSGGGIPDFAHESTMTGGASAEPGMSGMVAFELTAGDWFILNTGGEVPTVDTLTVTGEFAAVEIPAAALIEMSHHDFTIPAGIAAGPQIWQLTNTDPVLHHIVLLSYPGEISEENALALVMAQEGAGDPPAGYDPNDVGFLGESGLLSTGVNNWVEFDLQPASYIALCFISDPGSEVPHVAEGMIEVFTVS